MGFYKIPKFPITPREDISETQSGYIYSKRINTWYSDIGENWIGNDPAKGNIIFGRHQLYQQYIHIKGYVSTAAYATAKMIIPKAFLEDAKFSDAGALRIYADDANSDDPSLIRVSVNGKTYINWKSTGTVTFNDDDLPPDRNDGAIEIVVEVKRSKSGSHITDRNINVYLF